MLQLLPRRRCKHLERRRFERTWLRVEPADEKLGEACRQRRERQRASRPVPLHAEVDGAEDRQRRELRVQLPEDPRGDAAGDDVADTLLVLPAELEDPLALPTLEALD